mgnify:CR=1 FL=1
MRILGISPNFNQNRSVNFGKFADNSTKRAIKKKIKEEGGYFDCQQAWDKHAFDMINFCKFVSVYTDKNTGDIKGQFLSGLTKSTKSEAIIAEAKKEDTTIETVEDLHELAIEIGTINIIEADGVDYEEAYKRSRSNFYLNDDGGSSNYAHDCVERDAYR